MFTCCFRVKSTIVTLKVTFICYNHYIKVQPQLIENGPGVLDQGDLHIWKYCNRWRPHLAHLGNKKEYSQGKFSKH